MLFTTLTLGLICAAVPLLAQDADSEADPEAKAPTLTDRGGLAIKGYDPVAYFPEGGGEPAKGDKSLTAEFRGATYRFANEDHRARFLADPTRYAPAYGGYCAFAMADGKRVEINPKSYEVHGDRLYLFYRDWFTNTLKPWQEKRDTLKPAADAAWADIVEDAES
ncbi:MAG: YHS domain-containing (seleno)protein [Planctomycetota bacterium]